MPAPRPGEESCSSLPGTTFPARFTSRAMSKSNWMRARHSGVNPSPSGYKHPSHGHLFVAEDAEHISIIGSGIIHGQGTADHGKAPRCSQREVALSYRYPTIRAMPARGDQQCNDTLQRRLDPPLQTLSDGVHRRRHHSQQLLSRKLGRHRSGLMPRCSHLQLSHCGGR